MDTMIKTTRIKNSVYYRTTPIKDAYSGYLYKQLSAEGCEDFYNYIDWLDLVKDLNVIVLPKTNHYYYIQEDLKNTKTVINLKPLTEKIYNMNLPEQFSHLELPETIEHPEIPDQTFVETDRCGAPKPLVW